MPYSRKARYIMDINKTILLIFIVSLIPNPSNGFSVNFDDQTIGLFDPLYGTCSYESHDGGYACLNGNTLINESINHSMFYYRNEFDLYAYSTGDNTFYINFDNYSNGYSYTQFSLNTYSDSPYYQWDFNYYNSSHISKNINSGYDDYVDFWNGSYGWKNIIVNIDSTSLKVYVDNVLKINESADIFINNINAIYYDSLGINKIDNYYFEDSIVSSVYPDWAKFHRDIYNLGFGYPTNTNGTESWSFEP